MAYNYEYPYTDSSRANSDWLLMETQKLKADVNALKAVKPDAHRYILVADSYGGLGWTQGVVDRLNLDAKIINAGGSGFVTSSAIGGKNWQGKLEELAATMNTNDKLEITDILVFGGYNDYSFGIDVIKQSIFNFVYYAKQTFPNAQIKIGCIAWSKRDNDKFLIARNVVPAYMQGAAETGCGYVPNMYSAIHKDTLIGSDGVHPTPEGIKAITDMIVNYILTGTIATRTNVEDVTFTPSGEYIGGSVVIKSSKTGETATLEFQQFNTLWNSEFDFSGEISTGIVKIGTLSNSCVNGMIVTPEGIPSTRISGVGMVYTNNQYVQMPYCLSLYNNDVVLSLENFVGGTTSPLSARGFILQPFTITCDLLNC